MTERWIHESEVLAVLQELWDEFVERAGEANIAGDVLNDPWRANVARHPAYHYGRKDAFGEAIALIAHISRQYGNEL